MKTVSWNILIVDDEVVVRDLVVSVLSSEGYLVDTAENGSIAQEKLAQRSYALCLIDLRMPGMGGKELYTFIKDKYPELAKRVVFVTGDTSSLHAMDFLQLTGRPNLVKPFSLDELRKVVAEEIRAASEGNF